MAITIEVQGHEFICDHGRWRLVAKTVTPLGRALLKLVRTVARSVDPSGSDPYPALTVAKRVTRELRGKVTRADRPKPFPPGTIL